MALLDNFSNFIRSPEAMGLAQGLLQGSAPNMHNPVTFGSALGQGFQHMNRAREEAEKRKLAEKYFGIAEGEYGLKKQEADRYQGLLDMIYNQIAQQQGGHVGRDQNALNMIDQNPTQQLPGSTQQPQDLPDAYAVLDPRINNGRLSYISNIGDNGEKISRDEAINYQLQHPEGMIGTLAVSGRENTPQDSSLLKPSDMSNSGGLLGKPSLEQLQKAAMFFAVKDPTNAIKALSGEGEQNLTGLPQEYNSLERMKKIYGENHPAVKATQRALDARLKAQEQMTKNREIYADTAYKRASTSLGKKQLELEEARSGYLPGSNGTIELSPEQQQVLVNQYELEIQKSVSDSDSRKRALFASNIDKTIERINVDDLVQFAGPFGAIEKKIEQGLALAGKESEQYAKFVENLAAVETLAMQIRQFYGESITPAAREAIESLVNPATWYNNPKLAKRQFESIRKILENETATFRGALTGTGEFKKQDKKGARPASEYSVEELQAIINAGS